MDFKFRYFKNSLDRTYCAIRYLQDGNLLVLTWSGTASEESIKEVKDCVLEMVQENQCFFILNDVQEFFSAPTQVLAGLTASDWDLEVRRLGVQEIAHVLKPDYIPANTEDEIPQGLTKKYFTDKLEAISWLKEGASKADK
ncbi:hypothetical protein [Pontibacter beigongshangensis]|uniref:hypothetical protein n=1 Tax=Pontibacter beigongshangensis TaxID=2574733 RepID=UPI00164F8DAF|nr:hypothetical protein [Pontibacter beigongshangensis]